MLPAMMFLVGIGGTLMSVIGLIVIIVKKESVIPAIAMVAIFAAMMSVGYYLDNNSRQAYSPLQQTAVSRSPETVAAPASTYAPPRSTSRPKGDFLAEGKLGDYYVGIKKVYRAKTWSGNDAMIVVYSFTNNSEETTGALTAISEKAFQDGKQLEYALVNYDKNDGAESISVEIRPGTTIDVHYAFELRSESKVELEFSEAFSFSDNAVVYCVVDVPQ